MEIIPAIDLIDGKCVRLVQGDYNQKTIYNDDALAVAKDFINSGAKLIHVVDLDGAKAGKVTNIEVIKRLVSNNIPIEVNSVQTEVDAGYEGKDKIVLIEAKNSNVENTIIK